MVGNASENGCGAPRLRKPDCGSRTQTFQMRRERFSIMATPVLHPEADAGTPYAGRRPAGVALLAGILLMYAAGGLMVGLLATAFAGVLLAEASGAWWGGFAVLGAAIAAIGFLTAIVNGVVGYGLWTGKPWAWYVQLGLSGLAALGTLVTAAVVVEPTALVWLLLNGAIMWYFFRPEVRRWFGQDV